MTTELLSHLIFAAGLAQACILVASAQVPSALRWREELRPLPRLHRQMHWVYSGYVVLSIVAFAAISLTNARALAEGGALARALCIYIAVFWGIRLGLQAVFDLRPYLTTPIKRAGATALTFLFGALTLVYGLAALSGPAAR
jgi:alginate O-acetyltransferase complex protein AlgI